MLRRWQWWVPACSLCMGCATGGGPSREPRIARPTSPVPSVTAAELSRNSRDESLLTALRRYRPQFLMSHGAAPMVTIDGSPLAELSLLETLRVSAISEVRLLRASTAVGYAGIREGRVVIGDVLYVQTRGRP